MENSSAPAVKNEVDFLRNQDKKESLKVFIWNRETKEILGRDSSSWGEIDTRWF
jgi:hypothetical protein